MGGGVGHLDTQTRLEHHPTPTLPAGILDPEPGALGETSLKTPVAPPCLPSFGPERQTDSNGASVLEEPGTCLGTTWFPEERQRMKAQLEAAG